METFFEYTLFFWLPFRTLRIFSNIFGEIVCLYVLLFFFLASRYITHRADKQKELSVKTLPSCLLPNSGNIACGVAELNTAHYLDNMAKKIKILNISSPQVEIEPTNWIYLY